MGEVVECLSVSEFSTTPSIKFNFWIKGNIGCPFVWFVYFGHAK